MAKAPTGSGVRFTPDATMNGPYNYTRADIPLYKPGAGYNTMVASPPGAPVTQTPLPPVKPPGGAGGNSVTQQSMQQALNNSGFTGTPNPRMNVVNNIDSTRFTGQANPRMNVANPIPDAMSPLKQMGALPRNGLQSTAPGVAMPRVTAKATGTGLALGGAGVGNALPSRPATLTTGGELPPLGTPTPPPAIAPPATGGLPVAPRPVPRPTTTISAPQAFQNPNRNPINPTQRNAFATALARGPR